MSLQFAVANIASLREKNKLIFRFYAEPALKFLEQFCLPHFILLFHKRISRD